ncbi:MAG: FtsH protease activity modulator HflK [Alphaproteobacteria bacterium]|nr:FtsH protease activity modulator HflK [Alphaproteobacteria bacterium]
MPWSNQGGGQGPWGRGAGGGGGQPPNFDEMLRRGQDRFKGMVPGGVGSGRGIILIIAVAVLIWLGTGFYRVQPDEQGVELIFGKWVDTTISGLNYNLPSPIGTVYTPKVTTVNRVEVGFRGVGDGRRQSTRDVTQESLMLTGDENIIDIEFVVFWKIDQRIRTVVEDGEEKEVQDGIAKFLFNIRNPEQTVKDAAESAMREIMGKSDFEFARTQGRAEIAIEAQALIQAILDDYGAGIEVTNVQTQNVDPPGNVLDAFRDVQAARADKERMINEANAYSNEIVERAEGEFQRRVRAGEAYKEEKIARAQGEASRFLAVFNEYKNQRDVTTQRIYLETMREILSGMDKVLIDNSRTGQGVVPYLPLDQLNRRGGGSSSGGTQ